MIAFQSSPAAACLRRIRSVGVRVYFSSIRPVNSYSLPEKEGIVIFASTHRNGAVDGPVLEGLLPVPLLIAGKNLAKAPLLGLLLGDCITIYRHPASVAEQRQNIRQLKRAADAAIAGRQLIMFPEGTSSLGPGLQPIKRGVEYLVRWIRKKERARPVHIIPVGLHYGRGFEFRSRVEVVFGPAITVSEENRPPGQLTRQLARAMARVAVIFPDRESQRRAELFADMVCALYPDQSHRAACLAYRDGMLSADLQGQFERFIKGRPRHGRPPVVTREPLSDLIRLALVSPVVLAAFILNLLPVLGAWLVAGKMADDDNVITLWRLLAGPPLLACQLLGYLILVCRLSPGGGLLFLVLYGGISWSGILLYDRWRRLWHGWMGMFSPDRKRIICLQEEIGQWLMAGAKQNL